MKSRWRKKVRRKWISQRGKKMKKGLNGKERRKKRSESVTRNSGRKELSELIKGKEMKEKRERGCKKGVIFMVGLQGD